MNKEEAERYLEILRAVPDSHGARIHVEFVDLGQPEGVHVSYWASVMVGSVCYGNNRDTIGEAVCGAIKEWGEAEAKRKVHMADCGCPECDPVGNDPREQGRGEITEGASS